MHHHRATHLGLTVFTALLLMLPLTRAQAQAGAPASAAVQGAWITSVDAPEWGETPTTIRGLMAKLQAVPRRSGPDTFDVVWLRELLRHPALYHLSDTDQMWMRRTIAAADQAHLSHWQPAAAATPVVASPPVTVTPVVTAPVVARTMEPAPVPRFAPTVRPTVPRTSSPPVTLAPTPIAPADVPSSPLSTGWAMAIAAVLVSAFIGVWISRLRPTPSGTPEL